MERADAGPVDSRGCYNARANSAGTGKSLSDDRTTDREALERRLNELRSEHRDLDDVIARVTDAQLFDQLQVQRLKKRKLGLKDEILQLEGELLPDIIA